MKKLKHKDDIPTLLVKLIDVQLKLTESNGGIASKLAEKRRRLFSELAFWFNYEERK